MEMLTDFLEATDSILIIIKLKNTTVTNCREKTMEALHVSKNCTHRHRGIHSVKCAYCIIKNQLRNN